MRFARSGHPSPVAALLWAVDAVAVASVLPLRAWSGGALVVLVAAVGVAAGCSVLRLTLGARLASWSLHVDVGLANLLVSAGAGASGHVGLAHLYVLVALFALLYLPLPPALWHLGAAGAAYALVLLRRPRPADQPLAAWLGVFGTAAALGAVVVGLAAVLRRTAREDPLTGLASRRRFDERLDEKVERPRRAGCPSSVAVADLDGCKALNDALGHRAGDRLLCDLAGHRRGAVRDRGDLVPRIALACALRERLVRLTPASTASCNGTAGSGQRERRGSCIVVDVRSHTQRGADRASKKA